ncbi:uncharacterized protein ARMOST_01473 [Armillaria ostoyae]|uniref:Alpha/beta hydrolase fold-3 domain-containing protein n=1 Tax=Armillaria ostoyae TaxID=47428 RepID=A0A284QP08_ARMOS|nr:uncharacterized protein ARMOST_01473 [Armillaria ostoyae]
MHGEHVDGLVGLWIHGGEYIMGNGSEYFGECGIANNIQEYSQVKYIVSVEYRLLHESCHAAQLLDAYSHLLSGHLVMLLGRHLYEEKALPMLSALMVFSVGDSCIRNSLRRATCLISSWMAAVCFISLLEQPRNRGYELLTNGVHSILRLSRKWVKVIGK